MTQSNEVTINETKYTAGIKLAAGADSATIILLERNGTDNTIAACQTIACSRSLREVGPWLVQHGAAGTAQVVAGLDSSCVRFLDIRIPPVDEPQRYPLVQTQAEAALPLSADQMALAWRSEQDEQGLRCRTAAVRRDIAGPLMTETGPVQIVVPEAVGLAEAWNRYSVDGHKHCVLLHRRRHDFLAAVMQGGHLQRSAVIDAEGEEPGSGIPGGLLLQDILIELESIERECDHKVPLYLLSESAEDEFLESLCGQLQSSGWEVEISFLEALTAYDCGADGLEAFGLALAAMPGTPIDFDFKEAERRSRPDPADANLAVQFRNAVAVSLAILLFGLGLSYWGIKKDVRLMRQVMASGHEGLTVQQVLDKQAYREVVARARPDFADLAERIAKCQGSILLNTLEFEKGKPVKITATATSHDDANRFQKDLESENKNVITKAKMMEQRLDQNGKQVHFTMTFHYRNFSQ